MVFYNCVSLKNVYYHGTSAEWLEVDVKTGNVGFDYATIYFYSESEPEFKADGTGYKGNHWHYDENGNPIVW